MSAVMKQLIAKLDKLPEPCLAEVLEVVDFLAWQSGDKSGSLLSVAGILPRQTETCPVTPIV